MNRDKERILKIISDIIDVSRLLPDENRRLTRNKLLALMNERRPHYAQLSRDEFQNHFTTRVDRKSIVPIEDLVCLIEVILEQYADCVTADAVLELCDAARLPLREYRRISRYFSITEWNRAWRMYDAATVSSYQDELVFASRERLITQIYQQFSQKPVVVVSGSSGIGKTRLALRVCTMVEADYMRVCVINGRDVDDIESFVEQLATVLRVRPFGKESQLQRLQYYLQDNHIFVFIDDLSVYNVESIIALLNHVMTLLPTLKILVTTTMQLPQESPHRLIQTFTLDGLDFQESQLLFRQSCYQLGFFAIDIPLITRQISQCEGNPMAIKMLAYIASQNYEHIELHQHMSRMMESLTDIEAEVIRSLVVFDTFVSIEIVATICRIDDVILSSAIQSLVQKGVVTLHNYNMVMCHVTVRVWYQSRQKSDAMRSVQIGVISALSSLQSLPTIIHPRLLRFHRSDITQLLGLMRRLVSQPDANAIDVTVQLLMNWGWYWWMMGHESDALNICVLVNASNHPSVNSSAFMLQNAILQWRCGNVELARNMLTTVEVNSTMNGDLAMVAIAKLEMALTYAVVYNQVIFTTYIRQAQQIFARLQIRDWQTYSLIQQAMFAIHEGNFDKGLEYCQEAETLCTNNHEYLHATLSMTRMTAYVLLGQSDAAKTQSAIAQQMYLQLNMDIELHMVNMYMWISNHLQYAETRSESYLNATILVSRLTQVSHVLLFADMVTLALYEDAHVEYALRLYQVISHARKDINLPRMRFFDGLLEQKRRASLILYQSNITMEELSDTLSFSEIVAYIKHSAQQVLYTAPRIQ